jgi:phage terminase large subunit GpA-like protein
MNRLRTPPRLSVSEWADRYRFLSPEASAEPGRWDTARAEYQRGMMDAIIDPRIEMVVVMKSAQVGWTEIIGNVVGYHVHQDPAPILVVQPTVEMGEAWSKDRLAPMLRDSPALRGKVGEARSRDGGNTLRHKTFPGGHLTVAGANSPASLASRPIRVVLFDEVDRYPPSAGREGDPVTLGRKRTATFWNRRILLGSTPTIAGHSRIEKAYENSDQRRFWVPCPHCEHAQVLRWDQVKWTDGNAATALYHCEDCGAGWTDTHRWAAVRKGEWRAGRAFAGVAGFHISEIYSPWRRTAETVADFLEAKAGGIEMLKAWKNTALGEVWEEAGEAPEWERLVERREPVPMGVVPRRAVVLTAGIDNQAAPERLEIAVWAWAAGYESWLIDTVQVPGNPGSAEAWDEVARLLAMDWPREGGGTMRIARAGADTGGQHTQGVYAQLRRLHDPRLMPLKGVGGWNKASPVVGPTPVDITIGGRKIARGLRLWTVAVDVFKAELYRRLWLKPLDNGALPTGWVHLPEGMSVEQVKQLVAEQLVTKNDRRGFARREWEKLRANEQLDMAVYARAALSVLGSDRYGEGFWERCEAAYVVAPPEPVVMQPAAPPPPKEQPPPPPLPSDAGRAVRRSIISRLA